MNSVENPSPELELFLAWLASVQLTPARFTHVMRDAGLSTKEKIQELGITEAQFREGINSLQSLDLYAQILAISREELWLGFESSKYIAPRWLIRRLEEAIQEHMAQLLR